MSEINVELPVTYKCDWHCSYCCAFTHDQPDVNFDELIEKAIELPAGTYVSLTGGEPGLLSKTKMNKLIKILKDKDCVIDVLTNGLFIKKHRDLMKYMGKVVYHCLEYLNDGEIQFPNEDVDYVLIVEPHDLEENVLKVMDKYPNIRFRLVPTKLIDGDRKMYFKFIKFFKAHSDRLSSLTMKEFVNEMARKPDSIQVYNGD